MAVFVSRNESSDRLLGRMNVKAKGTAFEVLHRHMGLFSYEELREMVERKKNLLMWCIRSSAVNKWVLYANPFLRFEQESGFLSFRKPSNNVVNYGYRTLVLEDDSVDGERWCREGCHYSTRER